MMQEPRNVELAHAFHAPFTIDSPFRPHSLRQTAAKKKKNIIVFEGGESLRMDGFAIQEGINGTLRLMKYLGMIDEAPAPAHENKIVWSSAWIRARTAGLFHPIVEAGQLIHKGQLVGEITDPFGEYREEVKTSVTGYVVGLNNNPVVNAGDALLHIGMDDHCRLEASGEE
jgi:predicted deacylase